MTALPIEEIVPVRKSLTERGAGMCGHVTAIAIVTTPG
jgi:hypothetical protein